MKPRQPGVGWTFSLSRLGANSGRVILEDERRHIPLLLIPTPRLVVLGNNPDLFPRLSV
jgi:hypothetical protein